MKIIVISDTHGNIGRLKHVLGFAKEIGASALIHCGDWDNIDSIQAVLEAKIKLYTTLGNADVNSEILKLLKESGVVFDELFLQVEVGGTKVGISHYKHELVKRIPEGFDIGFFGHTHKKEEALYGGVKLINPGAIFRTDKPSFVVYDIDKNKIEFLPLEDK
jgi:hypothetical protein